MANRNVFNAQTVAARKVPKANTRNDAGGLAYEADPKYALALYACAGTFNGTFYASEHEHYERVQGLLTQIDDPMFIAKVAVYARKRAHMKDVPAYLLAELLNRSTPGEGGLYSEKHGGHPQCGLATAAYAKAFPLVIDNGKMACTFTQIVKCGAAGRSNFGTGPRRLFKAWFEKLSDDQLFRTSIGTAKPGLVDVMNLIRPRVLTESRQALGGYLKGMTKPPYPYNPEKLPKLVQQVEAFKADPNNAPVPDISFQLLSSVEGIGTKQWTEIALHAPWQTLRMNLNMFKRHGVLENKSVVEKLAAKLRDEMAIGRARVLPYQILVAYLNTREDMPAPIVSALHDAMEIAVRNVPVIEGNIVIGLDVSASMTWPITGKKKVGKKVVDVATKMNCVQVAALMTASLLRKNPSARLLPFSDVVTDLRALNVHIEPRDTIMTNAAKLASLPSGGTNCAAPLHKLVEERAKDIQGIFIVSDYESWMTSKGPSERPEFAQAWAQVRTRNPNAKLICNDIVPKINVQVNPDPATLLVGGFSDEVFNVASLFLGGALAKDQWLARIDTIFEELEKAH